MGMPWPDQLITYRTGKSKGIAGKGMFDLAARLRAGKFELAILLPNSFKSALLCKMAGIPRVVGYERDGRSFLLTDRLLPVKEKGKFVPVPIVGTYMGLARYLGSQHGDMRLQLWVTDAERCEAEEGMRRAGLEPEKMDRPGAKGGKPLVLLNPGAQYGAAKCWPVENFAELGDRLMSELGATVVISGTARERGIVDGILGRMKRPALDLSKEGLTLGAVKEIVRRCDLMVTNDTGPRHIAAAFEVPVVTIFGPTHMEWTEINFARERKVAIKVFCGPCQKKVCPLDHRCMTGVTPGMVFGKAIELLGKTAAAVG
jgi:heptosyltransferase-2